MPLEEKVGAIFIIGINGIEVDEETEKFIKSHYFRNFLLLGKNIQNEPQLKSLTSSLCKSRGFTLSATGEDENVNPRDLQCLISIDQEGGKVSRIKFGDMDQTPQLEGR